MKLHLLDTLIIIVYLAMCVFIAFFRAPKIKTPRQFALGYKEIPTAILVCTIFASTVGAGSTFGYAEKLYTLGLVFVVGQLFTPLYWLISARIFAPRIAQFKDCISLSQVMYKLYGSAGRWVTNFASIIMGIGAVAAQSTAIGYIFHYFLGIEVFQGVIISSAILTLYSALGGTRAVIVTEVFQFSIFFFMLPVSYVVALTNINGLQDLTQKLPVSHWRLDFTVDNIILLVSFIFYTLLPEVRNPVIQRYLMASSARQLNSSLRTVALLSIPFTLSMCLIAYIVKAHSPEIPANEVLLFYINNYLPIGFKGLMAAGIIAAIMGVTEAWLNSTSVILVNDIIKVWYPTMTNEKQLGILRLSVVIISAISMAFASLNISITNLIWLADNFWGSLVLIPVSAGFLGFKTSGRSFVASSITAMTCTLFGRFISGEFATISLCLGIAGSAAGLFGAHYWYAVEEVHKHKSVIRSKTFAWLWNHIVRIKNLGAMLTSSMVNFIKQIQHASSPKGVNYKRFATFTLVYYFIYTFNLTSAPAHKILSYLLIIGYLLCFILLLRDVIFSKSFQKNYLSWYWYFTLTFCLPLVASYMLFVSQGDDFWIINGLLSAFSLYFFVDAVSFFILLSIGIVGGYVLFTFSGSEFIMLHIHNTVGNIGYIYLFFLLASLIFFRGREKEHEEKVANMHMLGGAIAHEVKTPISAMSMSAQAIADIINRAAYTQVEVHPNKVLVTYDKDEYEFLMKVNQTMQSITTHGVSVVDGLLTSLKNSVVGDEKKLYEVDECIKQTIKEFSKVNEKVKNIEIDIRHNFKIWCSLHYIKHVLFNLIKNSYRHGGNDVKIEIRTSKFKLHFKDYGKGISKEDLPRIFDKFYTKSKVGTGIGLAFCKMVMEDLGGSIECKSELGKYTEFTLIFPEFKKAGS